MIISFSKKQLYPCSVLLQLFTYILWQLFNFFIKYKTEISIEIETIRPLDVIRRQPYLLINSILFLFYSLQNRPRMKADVLHLLPEVKSLVPKIGTLSKENCSLFIIVYFCFILALLVDVLTVCCCCCCLLLCVVLCCHVVCCIFLE